MNTVQVTFDGEKYTADAKWLPGSPPVARGWSTQELAIAVLREMIVPDKDHWGEWPKHYNVEVIIEGIALEDESLSDIYIIAHQASKPDCACSPAGEPHSDNCKAWNLS